MMSHHLGCDVIKSAGTEVNRLNYVNNFKK
ncbi:hypothetical protein E2C01_075875 [Portunus trituberculatus]|uniref:Uncharacterized protein n=1 Tax=Portunus trituberculatus TaxID=210409 RepID=A0A5B7IKI2_PORTR|nr:hypothetical protein [Portunus trituberculatus]